MLGNTFKISLRTLYREKRYAAINIADHPENTHFKYNVLFTLNNPNIQDPTSEVQLRQMLFGVNHYTYLKMREGFDPANWTALSQTFFDNNMREFGQANGMAFVLATLVALAVAYITVALQSWRTAQSDPSLSLRHE